MVVMWYHGSRLWYAVASGASMLPCQRSKRTVGYQYTACSRMAAPTLQVFIARQYTKNSYGYLTLFLAQNDDEKWSRKKYVEIPWWPSEIPANLPGQFSLSGQIFKLADRMCSMQTNGASKN